jgi:hypothetical protein
MSGSRCTEGGFTKSGAVMVQARVTPVRKNVTGFKMDPTAHHFFDKVDLAK